MLGLVDCHFHVIGPVDRYPMMAGRSYTPVEAALSDWQAVMHPLGVVRGVLVQPSIYGTDNRLLVDTLVSAAGSLVGIAAVSADVGEVELDDLAAAGVRGVRMAYSRGAGVAPASGLVHVSALERLAPRLKARGMHLNLLTDSRALTDLEHLLRSSRLPVVLDHMGRVPVEHGAEHEGIQTMCRWLGQGWIWVKLSGLANLSMDAPDFDDVYPLHAKLLQANPLQLLWGSDWPFTRTRGPVPEASHLMTSLQRWTPEPDIQTQILSRNPQRLYGWR
jgi:2-pyrone-4,6-dicarboxylate lactonase